MSKIDDLPELVSKSIPAHVAIIMDGNGRWAQNKGKSRITGHRAGVASVRETVAAACELGIKSLTIFAFSSENWRRPTDEVNWLLSLFMIVLRRELRSLVENDVRLKIIGDLSKFSPKLQKQIRLAEESTENNNTLTLNVAANYGGKWDVVQACTQLATRVEKGEIKPVDIDENMFASFLCLQEQEPIDLLIRTGGEYRISNFILWQAAYAELIFTETLWPDFGKEELKSAVVTFAQRQRRFGLTGNQIDLIKNKDRM